MNCTGMYLVSLENSFQKTQIIKGFFTETISVLSRQKSLDISTKDPITCTTSWGNILQNHVVSFNNFAVFTTCFKYIHSFFSNALK